MIEHYVMLRVLLASILTLSMASLAQGLDSLYFNPGYEYTQEDVDSIIANDLILGNNYEIFGQILESSDLDGWEWFYLKQGTARYEARDFPSAKLSLEKALKYLDKSSTSMEPIDYKCRLEINLNLGEILNRMKLHNEAIKVFQFALDDTKHYPYRKKSFLTAGIAGSHFLMGNDSIAFELILQVSEDSVYMESPQRGIFVWNTMAILNHENGNADLAKEYFKKALAVGEENNLHTYDQALSLNLVDLYWVQDSIEAVKYYLELAASSYKKYSQLNQPNKIEFNKKANATLKIFNGEVEEGIQLLQEIIDTVTFNGIENKDDKAIVGGCYSVLSFAYSKLYNHAEALKMLKEKIILEKWYSNYQLNEQLQKLEIEYQAKEKDLSISTLTNQTIEQSVLISQQRLMVLVGSALIGVLGIIGFLVYHQRELKAKYKEANLQQRLLRTQMDPHFVYNSLNSISSMVYQKSDMAIPYISKLASLLRLILENSRQELIPLEDEITALESYLSLESNFGQAFKFSIDTTDLETNEYLAPPMLIQPFVENSIKHGFKGIQDPEIDLSISINKITNLLEVSIVDNGVGVSRSNKNKQHKSIATSIVRERLAIFGEQHKVDARLEVSDLPDRSGTRVFMTIPCFSNN